MKSFQIKYFVSFVGLTIFSIFFTSCDKEETDDGVSDTEKMLIGSWVASSVTDYYIHNNDTLEVNMVDEQPSFTLSLDHIASYAPSSNAYSRSGSWYVDDKDLSISASDVAKLFRIQELTNAKLVIYEDSEHQYKEMIITKRHVLRMVKN